MIPPSLPSESHKDDLSQNSKASIKPDDKKITEVISNLVYFRWGKPDTVRKLIREASQFSVSDFKQRGNLDEVESCVKEFHTEHCKSITGRIKSLFGQTFEGKCKKLLRNVHAANTETEKELEKVLSALPSSYARYHQIIKSLPPAERAELLNHIQFLSEKNTNPEDVLYYLNEIPRNEITEVLRLARPLLEKTENNYKQMFLLRLIGRIPSSERVEVLSLAEPLLVKVKTDKERETILWNISAIPQSERTEVVRLAQPLLEEAETIDQKISLLMLIRNTPQSQRAEILRLAQPLLEKTETADQKISLLRLIRNTPQVERAEVLSLVQPWLIRLETDLEQLSILQAIREIPPSDRAEVLRLAQPLLEEAETIDQKTDILRVISQIPSSERAEILTLVQSFFTNVHNTLGRLIILRTLIEIPQNDIVQIVHAMQLLTEGLSPNQQIQLLSRADRLTAEQWTSITERIRDLPPSQRLSEIDQQILSLQRYDFQAPDMDKYELIINRKDLTESPTTVLHNLVKQFSQKKTALKVEFNGEPGVDASGLSRECISLLFDGIKDTMKFSLLDNGLYKPWLPEDSTMTPHDKQSYTELGKLIMFCLNSTQDYPIGMIFDEGVFIALKALAKSSKLNSAEFTFDELFAIYAMMNSNNDDDNDMIKRMNEMLAPLTAETSSATLQGLFACVEMDENIENLDINYDLDKIREHFPVLQAALRRQLEKEKIWPSLAPLIEIAKGMKSAPFNKDLLNLNATALSEKLQGTVSRELILSKLEFKGFSDEQASWVRNWIKTTSDAKIKQFLHSMTGSSALGKTSLKIANHGDNIYFHTCFNAVDIPLNLIGNEEMLHALIESAISGKTGYSRS